MESILHQRLTELEIEISLEDTLEIEKSLVPAFASYLNAIYVRAFTDEEFRMIENTSKEFNFDDDQSAELFEKILEEKLKMNINEIYLGFINETLLSMFKSASTVSKLIEIASEAAAKVNMNPEEEASEYINSYIKNKFSKFAQ